MVLLTAWDTERTDASILKSHLLPTRLNLISGFHELKPTLLWSSLHVYRHVRLL